MREPLILSTVSSEYFARLIADHFPNTKLMQTERKKFGDDEKYFRLDMHERNELIGEDVIIVASTNTDEDFSEICRVGTAVAKYGARRLVFVIPFFGYSTMERAVKPGEIVTAKINARILSQLPNGDVRNCFLMMDLHVAGLVHYFEGECLRFELYAEPIMTSAIEKLGLSNFMFASADLSRSNWVSTFARIFKTSIALIDKSRDFETTKVERVIGNVSGKKVIIYDDMIRSGTSLVHAAEAYLDKGAEEVYAVTSHLALNDLYALQRLENSPIKKIISTNTHPMSYGIDLNSTKFVVKDVSHIFTDVIDRLQ